MSKVELDIEALLADGAFAGRGRTGYVQQDIHIHRAPTDESIALFNEFQQKARESMLGSINLADNGFDAHLHFWIEPMRDVTIGFAKFWFNGRELEAKSEIENWREKNKMVLVERLQGEIARVIAAEVMSGAFQKQPQDFAFLSR